MESDFAKLPCEEAIQLFKGWGFLVEQGPGPEEVTLILQGPDHQSYYVCELGKLSEMAEAVLRVRRHTGVIMLNVGCEVRA